MELLVRVIMFAVIAVVLLLAAYFMLSSTAIHSITKQQAETQIINDLTNKYPNSEINIINTTPSSYSGSWEVVAAIVTNSTSPCPSYFVDTFEYPQFGFVNRTQNVYTSDCTIRGYSAGQEFNIYNSPVAITRAYMLDVPNVMDYILSFGFNNVTVHASLFNSTSLHGSDYMHVWLINYSSGRAGYYVYVVLSQPNGSLLNSYTAVK
jgi:hypothetical protein